METVRIWNETGGQIHQGDIFINIRVLENLIEKDNILVREDILFPFVICLNQECDLTQNFSNPEKYSLLHLLIVPAFLYSSFLEGDYWGGICKPRPGQSEKKNEYIKQIKQNQVPRYHYLEFPSSSSIPPLILDFKQFFTINRDYLYNQVPTNRLCSLVDLFKENISHRFSFFISRIGLPTN